MQRMSIPAELSQRLGENSEPHTSAHNQLRTELEAQIQQYLQNGGTVTEIPNGVSATTDGLIPLNDAPGQSFAVARPNKNQQHKIARFNARNAAEKFICEGGRLVTKSEAADILGYQNLSTFTNHITRKKIPLTVVKRHQCRVYYERAAVEAIAAARKRET